MSLIPVELWALASAVAGAAPEPSAPLLQPSKPWAVDYAETACNATRQYGPEHGGVLLLVRPSLYDNVLQLVVMRDGGHENAEHVDTVVRAGGHKLKTTGLQYGRHSGGVEYFRVTLDREAAEAAAAAGEIEVDGGHGLDWRVAVPGMDKLLPVLAACNANLRKYWNASPEAAAALRSPAHAPFPLFRYFKTGDYPAQSLRNDQQGMASVLLMVDEGGKVSDCVVDHTSGNASIDAVTCLVLAERAKLRPAVDASGKPAKSVLRQTVGWKISF